MKWRSSLPQCLLHFDPAGLPLSLYHVRLQHLLLRYNNYRHCSFGSHFMRNWRRLCPARVSGSRGGVHISSHGGDTTGSRRTVKIRTCTLRFRNVGKYRPCILVRNASSGTCPAIVFLMGTLEGVPIEHPSCQHPEYLSRVLQGDISELGPSSFHPLPHDTSLAAQ
ncbi:hypothetical protein BD311DRAFT_360528 [Dichomitus squalens]|uniref:Uncharacterized protein n=1 Tax=Dichomitus squalens TaxID=114155 RepID=A0A4V2K079_9APHY|nr:hypothetical protein BD311DRAFT_360528 [Dichomitus squalens]